MKRIKLFIATGLFLGLVSCTSSTRITGVWRNNSTEREMNYESFAILVLTSNNVTRATVEENMVDALARYGKNVVRSIDLVPPSIRDQQLRKEDFIDSLRKKGIDAIITVALLKEDTETRHVGSVAYAPLIRFGWYGSFWGYYSHWYPRVYIQDYVVQDKIYYIEINVYDVESESLIWSAQSETYNQTDLESASKEFSRVVAKEMIKYDLFNKNRQR